MRNNKGYTLIEAIVVSSIIFSTLIFINYHVKYLEQIQYEAFIESVYNSVKTAKEVAAYSNKFIEIKEYKNFIKIYGEIYTEISVPNFIDVRITPEKLYFSNKNAASQAGTITITYDKKRTMIKVTPVVSKINFYN
ncbi:hypothetical protein AN641_03480 [Candidatus Epulonipiscioides gigas]|nr:hypothetical protein AN641_03480 [Epulopiscium sp. SCG-C07WGA-EpuloA2]